MRWPRWLGLGPAAPGQAWLHRRNKLLCVMAALGIGTSLWAYWLTYTDVRDRAASIERIAEACDGVVDAEAVMGLRGGIVRASSSSDNYDDLRLSELPSMCRIYWVPEPGESDGLFSLMVRTSGDRTAMNLVGDEIPLEPFGDSGYPQPHPDDVTRQADSAEPYPLGDGSLGYFSDSSVTVRAVCASGKPASVKVTARADYKDVSDEDRKVLAELARGSAARAAARLTCDAQLPQIPGQLETPGRELRDPESADASCAWYRGHLQHAGRERLPDRMLETPVGAASGTETCLLAVSPSDVRHIAATGRLNGSQRENADRALTHSPWWVRTASFFGAEAESVAYEDLFDYKTIKAGTVGGGEERGVWWASSVCDGEPALHTVTVSYTYDDIVAGRLPALFQAYVDDITKRRGCTDVELPAPSAFKAK
ncbi:hypothetical protein [Streptomyces sp. NPDC002889]|uniref:hypothetical protein n=1 Tax=Streptomyces sp. NPDC002889 TaxID=3364669 RepID=UPI0036BB6F9D